MDKIIMDWIGDALSGTGSYGADPTVDMPRGRGNGSGNGILETGKFGYGHTVSPDEQLNKSGMGSGNGLTEYAGAGYSYGIYWNGEAALRGGDIRKR